MLPLTYYDIVLASIPIIGAFLLILGLVLGVPIDVAILGAAIPVLALMTHAMFVRGPSDECNP